MQDCINSIVNVLELLQSCTKPMTYFYHKQRLDLCLFYASALLPEMSLYGQRKHSWLVPPTQCLPQRRLSKLKQSAADTTESQIMGENNTDKIDFISKWISFLSTFYHMMIKWNSNPVWEMCDLAWLVSNQINLIHGSRTKLNWEGFQYVWYCPTIKEAGDMPETSPLTWPPTVL